MAKVSFSGLHIVPEDLEGHGWFIAGDFQFEDEADFEEFKNGIQAAFEFVGNYKIPIVLTEAEYSVIQTLPDSAMNE